MQPDGNNGARPAGRRAAAFAAVLVLLHLLLPWLHDLQHACAHAGGPVSCTAACGCGHGHDLDGHGSAARQDGCDHDHADCRICHQLRLGNPLLAAEPPRVAPGHAPVRAAAVLTPRQLPPAAFWWHAPARGPPCLA